MKLIEPRVEIIKEQNPFRKIEMAGRTCYKSESAITDTSSVAFYERLVKSHHVAMLEHSTFVFITSRAVYEYAIQNRFLNATFNEKYNRYIVSGNLRAINESGIAALLSCLAKCNEKLCYGERLYNGGACYILKDVKNLPSLSPMEIALHKYTTMRFIMDRGVSHEFVRHRLFSFAQESTRYVCYSKEKFGGGDITFIKPAGYDKWTDIMRIDFMYILKCCEDSYNNLTAKGMTAQQARAVLPNALKTELIVTGNDAQWQHFFNLRSKGITGAPHPDMKVVADMAYHEYYKGE